MNNNTPGILSRGTKIKVGAHTLFIDRYLSAGGYAHVYICTSQTPIYNSHKHVLKRIAVQSLQDLKDVGNEVEMMKLVRNSPHIVNLIDAAAYKLPQGGHEVFILMELCAGGGLIDIMNQHLKTRLTEAQILDIFLGVTDALTHMHALSPKILHRDLKIENILRSTGSTYKLCDFGSATLLPHPLKLDSVDEIKRLEAEFNKVTTIQYRSPEMLDLYQWRYIDEKCDIWALGVLLYKLCYYTTPFENGQGGVNSLAILNAQYSIPTYPLYSSSLNTLISSMLRQAPRDRPSAVEILKRIHQMRGTMHEFKPPHAKHAKQPSPMLMKTGRPLPTPPKQPQQASNTSAADMYKLPAKKSFLSPSDVTPQRRGRVRSIGEESAPAGTGAEVKANDPWHVEMTAKPLKAVQTTHTRTTHTTHAKKGGSLAPSSPSQTPISAAAAPKTSKSLPSKLETLGNVQSGQRASIDPPRDTDLDTAENRFPDLDAFGDQFDTLSRRTVRVDTGGHTDSHTQPNAARPDENPPESPDGLVIEEILPRHLRVPKEMRSTIGAGVGIDTGIEKSRSRNSSLSKSDGTTTRSVTEHKNSKEIENLMDARIPGDAVLRERPDGALLSPSKTDRGVRSPSPLSHASQKEVPPQSPQPRSSSPSPQLSSDDDAEDIEHPLSRNYTASRESRKVEQKQSENGKEHEDPGRAIDALKADLRWSPDMKGDDKMKSAKHSVTTVTTSTTTIASPVPASRPLPTHTKSNLQLLVERDLERTKAQSDRDGPSEDLGIDATGYDRNAYPLISPIKEDGDFESIASIKRTSSEEGTSKNGHVTQVEQASQYGDTNQVLKSPATARLVDIDVDTQSRTPNLQAQSQAQTKAPSQLDVLANGNPMKGRLVDISEPSSPNISATTPAGFSGSVGEAAPPHPEQLIDVEVMSHSDKDGEVKKVDARVESKPTLRPKPQLKSSKSTTPIGSGGVDGDKNSAQPPTPKTDALKNLGRRHTLNMRPRAHNRSASIGNVVDRYETLTVGGDAGPNPESQRSPKPPSSKSPLKTPKAKPIVAAKSPHVTTSSGDGGAPSGASRTPNRTPTKRPTSMYVHSSPNNTKNAPEEEESRFPGVAARIQQWNKQV